MTFESVGKFTLGANKFRKTEKQPTHTGKVTLNGETYRISGWLRENENGKYISGEVQIATEPSQGMPAKVTPKVGFDDLDEPPF